VRFVIRLLVIYAAALSINYGWEMLQMPFYENMSFTDPDSYLQCLWASFGDANIVISLYGFGLLVFRDWRWPLSPSLCKFAYLIATGGGIAVLIELRALGAGRWSYSSLMPLIPLLRVGAVPFAQLIILPYLTYLLVCRTTLFRSRPAMHE
jgi:hypothetical protein